MGVAFAAGAITHVLLFIGYGFFRNGVIGNAGLPVYVVVTVSRRSSGGSWEACAVVAPRLASRNLHDC